MRKIKFRAQYVEDKTWKYGFLNSIGDFAVICSDNGRMYYQCFKETVGQFTGLRDKNRREIYDKDICELSYTDPLSQEETKYVWIVEIKPGLAWLISCDGQKQDIPLFMKDSQVRIIGNIYENPELLEG